MNRLQLADGVAHNLPDDLKNMLLTDTNAVTAWQDITPLARNEFICWIEDAKKSETRARRIKRTLEELLEGQRRPCCWMGCVHRADKAPSPSQKFITNKRRKAK